MEKRLFTNMRKLTNSIKYGFNRAFTTSTFFLSIIGLAALNYINLSDEIRMSGETYVYYLFMTRTGLGGIAGLSMLFSVLPFSTSYISDIKNHYLLYAINRNSIRTYCISRVIVTATITFITTVLGYLLLIFILSLQCPILPVDPNSRTTFLVNYPSLISWMLESRVPVIFFVASILPEALCYSFLSIFALFISARTENIFVIFASPLILFYLSLSLEVKLPWNINLNWIRVLRNGVVPDRAWINNICITWFYFTIGIIIFGYLFYRSVKRRVNGEAN